MGKFAPGLPSFVRTGRIPNGTGDKFMGARDGMGPKDVGVSKSGDPKPKKKKRPKVNKSKFKGFS